jgi:hypothetical protein
VGRNPAGGLTLLGEFADDFVAYGTGRIGLFPCVTCAEISAGTQKLMAKQLRTVIRESIMVSLRTEPIACLIPGSISTLARLVSD